MRYLASLAMRRILNLADILILLNVAEITLGGNLEIRFEKAGFGFRSEKKGFIISLERAHGVTILKEFLEFLSSVQVCRSSA